jgi:hypothetical protein
MERMDRKGYAMTIRNSSLAVAVLLSQILYITAFSQKPSETPDEDLMRVFTKPDGTQITARIDRYSPGLGTVRAVTEDGEYIETTFDKIAPQNQAIILNWKMNQIIQNGDLDVTFTRKQGDTDTGYIKGTDIKVDKDTYSHELTLENTGEIPITDLTIEYAIAYERRQMVGRGLRDPQGGLGYHAVTLPVIDSIAVNEKKVIVTPPIVLKTYENVDSGGGNREEGGGKSAEDYKGVLFRFKRNGVTLLDVARPSGIVNREFSLKPIPDDATPGSNRIPQSK